MTRYLLNILAIIFLSSCANKLKLPSHPNSLTENAVEMKEYDKFIAEQDDTLEKQKWMNDVNKQIAKSAAKYCRNRCFYEVEVLNKDELEGNIPSTRLTYANGEKVLISKEIFDYVNKTEELAVIIGNEYAHNILGHYRKRNNGSFLGAVLSGLGIDAVDGEQIDYKNYNKLEKKKDDSNSYAISLDEEKQADYLGLYIVDNADYNLLEGTPVWDKIGNDYISLVPLARTRNIDATLLEIAKKRNIGMARIPESR